MKRLLIAALAAGYISLGYVPMTFALAETPKAESESDVIARVGDQSITFSEINIALNSSAIVGLSVPALGTPDRDTVRVTLLDRYVSANLLYLDARKRGLDKDPEYLREMERFDNAILLDLYLRAQRSDKTKVSEDEVQAFYEKNVVTGTELTPDLRAAIESKLRREKARQQLAETRKHVRDDVEVVVYAENLAPAGDAKRADSVALAEIDGEPVTWGSVKDIIVAEGKGAVIADPLAMEVEARRQSLETVIDLRIMAGKARAAGLEQEPIYRTRADEYHKTRLINLHRERLVEQMEPTDEELKAFYEANKTRIVVPESRKVQMVVLKTQEEAEEIKAKIDDGEMTMYQAAQQHSVAAKAEKDLGEVGWVYQGETVPSLDEVIFELGPGELSKPVETPAGWHLVLVQDMKEANYSEFDDEATRKLTRRRYLDQKLNAYVVELRENQFEVEVYEDVLVRLAQQEADMVKQLAEQAEDPASITQQRLKELGKGMNPVGK